VETTSAPETTWQVAPSGGSNEWGVTTTDPNAAPATRPAAPSSEAIFDRFVAASTGIAADGAVPPVAPAAFEAPAVSVELDPDTPQLKALAKAAEELAAREAALIAKREPLAARVAQLEAAVEKLREEAAAKAAAAAATSQANPFITSPGLSFAPVSSTVPVIDANLSSRLDSYLAGKGSPLAGLGSVFVYQSTAVGLDPRLLVAISGAETSFGVYGPSQRIHNPFGMGPGIVYPSWQDSIASAARNLGGRLYKGSGLVTIAQIQRRWAPLGAGNDPTNLNSHWYKNVSRYYAELGGDPNGTVFTDRAASPTAIPVAPGVAPGIQGTVSAPTAYGAAVAVPGGGRNSGPAAVQFAVGFIGVPYRAAGLVQFVYAKQGVTLPRSSAEQARVGAPIAPEQLTAGDAIFFGDRAGNIRHEGLYVGKGYFVHAPQPGEAVRISSLYDPYYATQYAGARRY
jgi:cell wall-associated NlpC family hydrolase